MELIISILALVLSLLVGIIGFIKYKSILINFYNLSKGMDVLFANQEKILDLTKIKGFVQLTHEEERAIKKEIIQEKPIGSKKVEGIVRPSDSNTDDQGS